MLTINITIEAELNEKLDDTGMFLQPETEKKLDNLMVDLENQLTIAGLDNIMVNYDFYDDDVDEYGDESILSEGIAVTEVTKRDSATAGWNTAEGSGDIGEVEEEGRKYKKQF